MSNRLDSDLPNSIAQALAERADSLPSAPYSAVNSLPTPEPLLAVALDREIPRPLRGKRYLVGASAVVIASVMVVTLLVYGEADKSAPNTRVAASGTAGSTDPTPTTTFSTIGGNTRWTGAYSAPVDHVGSDYSWMTPVIVAQRPERALASFGVTGDVQLGQTHVIWVPASGGWQVKVTWAVTSYSGSGTVVVSAVESDQQVPADTVSTP